MCPTVEVLSVQEQVFVFGGTLEEGLIDVIPFM